MYVCICKGVTERQIREAFGNGMCTRKDVSRCLKVGTACGKCNQSVRTLLHQCGPGVDHGGVLAHAAARDLPTGVRPAPGAGPAPESVVYRRELMRGDAERAALSMEPAACLA